MANQVTGHGRCSESTGKNRFRALRNEPRGSRAGRRMNVAPCERSHESARCRRPARRPMPAREAGPPDPRPRQLSLRRGKGRCCWKRGARSAPIRRGRWPSSTRTSRSSPGASSAPSARALGELPLSVTVDGVLFCHATPRDWNECFVRTTAEEKLRPIFEAAGAGVVVCGHTHMPFDRAVGRTRVVNTGSIGMPFGPPGANGTTNTI